MQFNQLSTAERIEDRISAHIKEICDARFEYSHHEPEEADEADHECVGFELEAELECICGAMHRGQQDLLENYLRASMNRLGGKIVQHNHIVVRNTGEFRVQIKVHDYPDEYVSYIYVRSNKSGNWITARSHTFSLGFSLFRAIKGITSCQDA